MHILWKEQFEKASCRTTTFEPWDERYRCPFDDCLEPNLDMLTRNAHIVDVHFTRQQENRDIGTRERPFAHGIGLSAESRPRSSCPSPKESQHLCRAKPGPFRKTEERLNKVDISLKSLSSAVTMEFRNHLEQDIFRFKEKYLKLDDPVLEVTLYGAEGALYNAWIAEDWPEEDDSVGLKGLRGKVLECCDAAEHDLLGVVMRERRSMRMGRL